MEFINIILQVLFENKIEKRRIRFEKTGVFIPHQTMHNRNAQLFAIHYRWWFMSFVFFLFHICCFSLSKYGWVDAHQSLCTFRIMYYNLSFAWICSRFYRFLFDTKIGLSTCEQILFPFYFISWIKSSFVQKMNFEMIRVLLISIFVGSLKLLASFLYSFVLEFLAIYCFCKYSSNMNNESDESTDSSINCLKSFVYPDNFRMVVAWSSMNSSSK